MDLANKTKELCNIYGIKPSRSKGQNFLINDQIYDDIITASDLQPSDTVLEIGPGLGFLTEKLAASVSRVLAVELDKQLAEVLQTKLITQKINNIEVWNEDILRFDLRHLNGQPYKIVANLPYNITSVFLRNFLATVSQPEIMVLMLQKEVATRIAARPGQMSLLAVSIQFYATAEIIMNVKADNFWPTPAVDSAVIKINILSPQAWLNKYQKYCPKRLAAAEIKKFFGLVRAGFSAKRKMLKNNLASALKIPTADIEKIIVESGYNSKIRAQELGVTDWLVLFAKLKGSVV